MLNNVISYRNGVSAWAMLSAIGGMDDLDPAITYALKEWLLERLGNEVKAYAKPHKAVEKVMEAVMVLRKQEPTWTEAKKQLGDPNVLMQLVNFVLQIRFKQSHQLEYFGFRPLPIFTAKGKQREYFNTSLFAY